MNFKKLLTWFGIIGSLASIVSLAYIFMPKERNLKLLVISLYQERLVQDVQKKEPDLRVEYSYKGIKIENLWKYNIRFINPSEKTLIGTSSQKNILTDYLTLYLKEGYEILDYKLIQSGFNHKLLVDSLQIRLTFEQWRKDEFLDYTFYIRAVDSLPDLCPFDEPKFREIVNGDIIFTKINLQDEKKKITEVIPPQGLKVAYIISLAFYGLFVFLITITFFLSIASYYQINRWYKRFYEEYIQFIKDNFPDNVSFKKKHIDNPKGLPANLWAGFRGERYPNVSIDLEVRNFYKFVLIEIILATVSISMLVTFIDLIYMFP
ncbi:MAG: hypothetical protein RBT74_11890 [Tenuifilaceae bacterium]|nr:hypothetical protein [Tenuifilaceae bacterium]